MNTKKMEGNARGEGFVQKELTLKRGRYCIVPFSSFKECEVLLTLEVYFTCNGSQLKFLSKTEKICEKVADDIDAISPVFF